MDDEEQEIDKKNEDILEGADNEHNVEEEIKEDIPVEEDAMEERRAKILAVKTSVGHEKIAADGILRRASRRRRHLFNIDNLDIIKDLNEKRVSEDIKRFFLMNGISLSDDAIISEKIGEKWKVKDGDNIYDIKKCEEHVEIRKTGIKGAEGTHPLFVTNKMAIAKFLAEKKISDEMRKVFEENGHALSENAHVVDIERSKWILKDGDDEFELSDTGKAIEVRHIGIEIYSLLLPHSLRGYILIETPDEEGFRYMLRGVPKVRGAVDGEMMVEEVLHFLTPKPSIEGIVEGDIVELIAGPFKGEKARVQQINETKEEITVELFEAVISIPITVRGDHVRLLERESKE